MEGLRQELWKAVSTNNALSLTQQIKNAFETFRTSLNAEDDGRKLFAGANTEDDAFKPKTLDDLAALPDVDLGKAYGNDQVRRAGRVGDGISFEFGILASDLGTDFLQAFKSLQSLGDLPDKMSDDQIAAVEKAAATIDTGLDNLRKINAQNGVRQNRVEAIETRITDRTRIITGVVSGLEDADLPQVQTALLAHRELLEISFKSYRDWTGLSLAAFLR
jgi:flagellar hook-associated protein 3 FlgL